MTQRTQQLMNYSRFIAGIVVLSWVASGAFAQTSDPWKKAKGLRPGDTIAIVAPAGPVDVDQVQSYATQLRESGYVVKVSPNIGRRQAYLAGSDQERVSELNNAIRDPQVRAIFPARGGFGLTRILDQVDYQALARDPKIISGYSDLTALHLAIAKKVGLITFHAPMPMSNLWKGQLDEFRYSRDNFLRAVEFSRYGQEKGYVVAQPERWSTQTLASGKAQGRLIGGNLTLISATMGTEYEMDARGAILFMEDIEEAPYRVDRMLSQLRLAGVLNQVAGVILGDFSYKDGAEKAQMAAVFQGYFEGAKYPVVSNFPLGHIASNTTLPHGALAELDAETGTLRLIENPVE